MLRYIMRHSWKQQNGASGSRLYSIDGDAVAVETKMSEGGFDEDAFDHHEFIGIEIIAPKASDLTPQELSIEEHRRQIGDPRL